MPYNMWLNVYGTRTSEKQLVPVATEAELLEFANKVRKAGGAEVIPALLPSLPCDPVACLIANALNFGCEVDGTSVLPAEHGGGLWMMQFLGGTHKECLTRRNAVAKALNLELYGDDEADWPAVLLPEHIGNAALAFDQYRAFERYMLSHENH